MNRKYKKGEQVVEDVTFVDVDCWGATAQNACKYLRVGDPVMIEGRLKMDQWTDKEGKNRSKLLVEANLVHFLSQKQRDQDAKRPDDEPTFP